MKNKVISVVTLLFLFGCYGPAKDEPSRAVVHPVAPVFELKDFSGKVHRLDEWKGQAVVIHFWASWCPPCLAEIPAWVAFAKKNQGKPIKFLAISLDKNWGDAQKVLADRKLPPNMISLLDTGGGLAEQYGSYQFPETYVLNTKHEISTKLVGAQKWSVLELGKSFE